MCSHYADAEGRHILLLFCINWATSRIWQTKLLDRRKVTQLNSLRLESVKQEAMSLAAFCPLVFFIGLIIIIIASKGAIRDFFTISSLRGEPSPTPTVKWLGCNHVQITCSTWSAYYVQHVVFCGTWYKGTAQLLSLTEFKSHLF